MRLATFLLILFSASCHKPEEQKTPAVNPLVFDYAGKKLVYVDGSLVYFEAGKWVEVKR
jgi:hypothetical protein